ncbi:MAG TPA: histidine kinase [Ruminiclostridium sp.]
MITKNKISKLSISKKISYSFIILCTILIICVTIIIRSIYSSLMLDRFEKGVKYTDSLISQQLIDYNTKINNCSNSLIIYFNTAFRHELQSEDFPNGEDIVTNRIIGDFISNNFFIFDVAENIDLIFNNDMVYSVSKINYKRSVSKIPTDFEKLEQLNVGTNGSWQSFYDQETGKKRFSYIKLLRNTQANKNIGYFVINIDENDIFKFYETDKSSEYSNFYIFDDAGEILSTSIRADMGGNVFSKSFWKEMMENANEKQSNGELEIAIKKFQYKLTKIPNTKWNLLSIVDYSFVQRDNNFITGVILMVTLVALIIFYLVIIAISRKISKPIQDLAQHMLNSGDELPQAIEKHDSGDEIEVLTTNFNIMIQKNAELFERVCEEERNKRHFELALIQAQIKPHFLYNTLDTAYCLIDIDKSEDAKKTIKLLADYYRLVLNNGSEWITLEKELLAAVKYMEIQKMRYNDRVTYSIDVAQEIMQLQIPNLTIQPLIENAIYHGLKPKNGVGILKILGEMQGDWINISIIDDGIGFDQKEFKRLLSDEEKDVNDSFGLRNINDRIKLFYGEKSGLALVENERDETVLTIQIYLGNKEV